MEASNIESTLKYKISVSHWKEKNCEIYKVGKIAYNKKMYTNIIQKFCKDNI